MLEKLTETGYIVPADLQGKVSSLENFLTYYPNVEARTQLEQVYYPLDGTLAYLKSPNGVLVAYGRKPEQGKQVLTEEVSRIIKKLTQSKASTVFLILDAPLYSKARDLLIDLRARYRVVLFQEQSLLFNPTRHVRVPKHTLLSPEQATSWMIESKIKPSQMPRITTEDIQAKYLDAVEGDVIRVEGYSPTVAIFVKHFLVVSA